MYLLGMLILHIWVFQWLNCFV